MRKIKREDEVIVLTGKDKGVIGKVTKILTGKDKVLVSGVNKVKKSVKPNPNKNEVGGIVEREMPIHISNIALYNHATKKADKVGFEIKDGKKIRIFKSTKKAID